MTDENTWTDDGQFSIMVHYPRIDHDRDAELLHAMGVSLRVPCTPSAMSSQVVRVVIGWVKEAFNTTNDCNTSQFIDIAHIANLDEEDIREDSVLVTFHTSMLTTVIPMFSTEFVEPPPRGLKRHFNEVESALEGSVAEFDPAAQRVAESKFPVKKCRNAGATFTFRLTSLIRLMKEVSRLPSVLRADATFERDTEIRDGVLVATDDGPAIDHLKFRQFIDTAPDALAHYMQSVHKGERDWNVLYKHAAERTYWNIIASKEYLERPEFQLAVKMVRRDVFGLPTPENVAHIRPGWQIRDNDVVSPFEDIMNALHKITNYREQFCAACGGVFNETPL